VQVFDQQGSLARPVAEKRPDGRHLAVLEHAAARKRRRLPSARPWVDRPTRLNLLSAGYFRRAIH
jgi:hypothetical protein